MSRFTTVSTGYSKYNAYSLDILVYVIVNPMEALDLVAPVNPFRWIQIPMHIDIVDPSNSKWIQWIHYIQLDPLDAPAKLLWIHWKPVDHFDFVDPLDPIKKCYFVDSSASVNPRHAFCIFHTLVHACCH